MSEQASVTPVLNSSWEAYKRLLRYTQRYWKFFVFAVIGFVINAQTEWAAAQLLKYIIDAIQNRDQVAKDWIPILIIGIFFVRGFGTFIGTYYMSMVSRHVVYALRMDLFNKLLCLPANFYHLNSPGHIASKLIYNVEQVTAAATEALKTIVREGAIVIGLFGYLLYTNWRLSLSLLLVGPFAAMLVRWAAPEIVLTASYMAAVRRISFGSRSAPKSGSSEAARGPSARARWLRGSMISSRSITRVSPRRMGRAGS